MELRGECRTSWVAADFIGGLFKKNPSCPQAIGGMAVF